MGEGGGPATGAAGPGGATGASAQLERCDRPLGTIALVESEIPGLAQFGLQSPIPVLRLITQQSGCFQVVERGQAFQAMMRERELMQQGQTRAGSNFGGGQMVAADLSLTPNVIFSGNTGGGGGGLGMGGLLGVGGLIAGAVAGALQFNAAEAVLTVVDNRSGVQVSAAQGSAEARDISIGAGLFGFGGGVGGGAGIGAYGNTPEGKVVTAALMNAFNNVVLTVRNMPPLPSVAGTQGRTQPASTGGRGDVTAAAAGTQLKSKGNLNLRGDASANAPILGRLTPGTIVTATGNSQAGWVEVQSGDTIGWVSGKNLAYP